MTYQSEVLADTPLVYWRLGETSGTNANDLGSANQDGTHQGSPLPAVNQASLIGDADKAVRYTGGTGQTVTATAFGLTTYSAGCAVEAVVTLNTADGFVFIGMKKSTGEGFYLVLVGGDVHPNFTDAASAGYGVDNSFTPELGVPHHYAAVYDGTDFIFYVDGVEFARASAPPTNPPQVKASTPFIVGEEANGDPADLVVDEAAFYGHSLSAARVAVHATAAGLLWPTPVVDTLAPTGGPAGGGNDVVITGTSLSGATDVDFGADPASFVVDDDTQITAVAPGGTGTVQVVVTTPGGSSG